LLTPVSSWGTTEWTQGPLKFREKIRIAKHESRLVSTRAIRVNKFFTGISRENEGLERK